MFWRRTCGLLDSPDSAFHFTAYHDPVTRRDVMYPIGIHWIARWLKRFSWWVADWKPCHRELEIHQAWHDGYNAGQADLQRRFDELREREADIFRRTQPRPCE